MAINLVRGFRRIGWVITFPAAVLIVMVFYENTREFVPSNYEATQEAPPTLPAYFFEALKQKTPPPGTVLMSPPGSDYLVELSGKGTAWFPGEVPKDVVERVLQDFEAKHKLPPEQPQVQYLGPLEPQKPPEPQKAPPTAGPWTKYQKPYDWSALGWKPVTPTPPSNLSQSSKPDIQYLGPLEPHDFADQDWTFTVHKRINKLELAGLIAGSLVIPALIIQGSISILLWVFKGFKG